MSPDPNGLLINNFKFCFRKLTVRNILLVNIFYDKKINFYLKSAALNKKTISIPMLNQAW